ncbi:unnamed protein product [Phyllotreta striolata]|uniref:Uncharacterized protein n=1 Tax=Phyllotreta striolata TaxID=444603 RepID=A0A9N9TJZ0_PHYSR|nr:unnamed protein product [Phyllotreta striolata]
MATEDPSEPGEIATTSTALGLETIAEGDRHAKDGRPEPVRKGDGESGKGRREISDLAAIEREMDGNKRDYERRLDGVQIEEKWMEEYMEKTPADERPPQLGNASGTSETSATDDNKGLIYSEPLRLRGGSIV